MTFVASGEEYGPHSGAMSLCTQRMPQVHHLLLAAFEMTPIDVSEPPPQAGDDVATPEPSHSDAELLHGLGALADLISNASDTVNQCLLTIEGKLGALPVTKVEWVPIKAARSAIERVRPLRDGDTSQERVFGGVPVTIMKFGGALASEPERSARCEWRYELGYSVAGDEWALMIRTAGSDRSCNGGSAGAFSDVMRLRDAPLEIRLKAIREIGDLIQSLDVATDDVGAPEPGTVPALATRQDVQQVAS
jgi:hypothetical protein